MTSPTHHRPTGTKPVRMNRKPTRPETILSEFDNDPHTSIAQALLDTGTLRSAQRTGKED